MLSRLPIILSSRAADPILMARSHVRLASTAVSIQIVEDAAGSGSRTAWMTAALAVAAAVTGVSSMTMKGKSTLCEEESAVTPSLAPRDTAPFQRFVSKGGIRDPMTTYQQYAIRREKELLQSTIGSSKDSVTTSPNSDSAATLQATSSTSETASSFKNNVSSVTMQAASSVAETVSFDEKIDGKSQVLGTQAVTTVDEASTDQPILDAATTLDGSAATTLDASAATLEDMSDAELRFEESTRKAKQHSGGLKIFSGNGNMSLALEIARHLGVNLGKATVGKFPDGEVNVVIHENVRGKDVYVVQPTGPPVNDNIMELLLMVSTLRRSSARRITVVIPYYGYARQDRKMQARVPISAADVARLMEAMGIDRVIAVDLHCGQIQGFFGPRVPVDNLDGGIVGLDYFGCKDLHNPVIVSPDAGGVYRAKKFKEGLEHKYDMQDLGLAMIVKQRARAGSVDQMDLVGDVKDCDCIIVDDMIDTAGTLCKAADVLVANGARRVFAFASHGLLSGPGNERIATSVMEEVVILNTIPTSPQREANEKLTELSVAPLLAQAIFNIHAKRSISALFK